VFFCGMPSEAAGPVVEIVTPIVMSARAGIARARASAALTAAKDAANFMGFLRLGKREARCSGGPALL